MFLWGIAKQIDIWMPLLTESHISYVDRNTQSFFLAPTSRNECKLNNLNTKLTSYGISSIPTCIFKVISEIVYVPLSILSNEGLFLYQQLFTCFGKCMYGIIHGIIIISWVTLTFLNSYESLMKKHVKCLDRLYLPIDT